MRTKIEILEDQNRNAQAPDSLTGLIELTVKSLLTQLEHRTIPARQRALRREAAARYLGVDAATLMDWAGQKPPKGPAFRRLGGRVVYLVNELDEFLDSLPRNTPHTASRGAVK